MRSANDKVTRAFEEQRPMKNRQQDDKREQSETDSLKPAAPARLGHFVGRAHTVGVGTATAINSGIGGCCCIHAQRGRSAMLRASRQSFSASELITVADIAGKEGTQIHENSAWETVGKHACLTLLSIFSRSQEVKRRLQSPRFRDATATFATQREPKIGASLVGSTPFQA